MKIAMPNDGANLNQHFGKSKSFVIITLDKNEVVDTKEISSVALQHNHGGLSNLLFNEGVSVVITGGIGAGALTPLKEKGLNVIRGASGTIEDVLHKYLEGSLEDKQVVCNHHGEHHK